MATIKDIARTAGVSQGTVSNVLNGKGNVSSKKIKLVMQTAAAMGYTINEKAKLLRKGSTKTLAVILPTIFAKKYTLIFSAFKNYAERAGFQVILHTTDDIEEKEQKALSELKANMVPGAALVSCAADAGRQGEAESLYPAHRVFMERKPRSPDTYIGFDYAACGKETAALAIAAGHQTVVILSDSTDFSNEAEFRTAAARQFEANGIYAHLVETSFFRCAKDCMKFFEREKPQAVIASNTSFAETAKNIRDCFYPGLKTAIYTLSPAVTMPERDFIKYELDYRQMGKTAAETLIARIKNRQIPSGQLPNTGYRRWEPPALQKQRSKITVLSMNAPATRAMQQLSNLFTESTGIEVHISTFNYDELFDVIGQMGDSGVYDIIRLDKSWLPKFAGSVLAPLETIDPAICSSFKDFMPSMMEQYAMVDGKVYALPSTPSVQFLFYRRDIFEDSVCKRLYFEKYREELRVPEDFTAFNRVAAFFTRSRNSASPTEYGSVLTLENTSTAAMEFLIRYFSHTDEGKTGGPRFAFDAAAAEKALRSLDDLKSCAADGAGLAWDDAAAVFAKGECAMAILFNNYTSKLLDYDSAVNGKTGYAMVPGGNPIFSGGGFGLTKNSGAQEESLAFIRWMCSETIATAMTMLGSVSPCNKTYENYEVIHTFPWLELTPKCFDSPQKKRSVTELAPYYDEKKIMEIIGAAVKNMYRETISVEAALALIRSGLKIPV